MAGQQMSGHRKRENCACEAYLVEVACLGFDAGTPVAERAWWDQTLQAQAHAAVLSPSAYQLAPAKFRLD